MYASKINNDNYSLIMQRGRWNATPFMQKYELNCFQLDLPEALLFENDKRREERWQLWRLLPDAALTPCKHCGFRLYAVAKGVTNRYPLWRLTVDKSVNGQAFAVRILWYDCSVFGKPRNHTKKRWGCKTPPHRQCADCAVKRFKYARRLKWPKAGIFCDCAVYAMNFPLIR